MREEIKTDRLVLRQLTLDDAPALSRLVSDYDISRMTGSFPYPMPLLSAEFRLMYLRSQKRRNLAYPYAITRDGGELMGMADLFRRSPDAALELGYWIGKPFWSLGYATEACSALLSEARDSLGVTRIVAGVFVDNPLSIKVLTKLGFKSHETYENWFSMARMEKAEGVNLSLNFSSLAHNLPLQENKKTAM